MPCIKNTTHRGVFVQDFLLKSLLATDEVHWVNEHVQKIKIDPRSFVGFFSFEGKKYYLKAYQSTGVLSRVVNFLGFSRPFRQWNKITLFCQTIESPTPLLVFCSSDSSTVYYATDFLENSRDLASCLIGDLKLSEKQAKLLLYDSGVLLGNIHQHGWIHGDLKWSNILVDTDSKLSIVDLDGLKRVPMINSYRTKGRDLARFILNAEEFLDNTELLEDFISGYCARSNMERNECIRSFFPTLLKLRIRHEKKYGVRGKKLF